MPMRASSASSSGVEGEVGHEQRDREADAAERRAAQQLALPDPPGQLPEPSRTAIRLVQPMPTNLPTTRPTITPQVTVEENARSSNSPLITTPALASANTGTMKKLDHGCSSSVSRSLGDTARSTDSLAERASSGSGDWPKARASAPASRTSSAREAYAGTSRPSTTPASVGWMPDSTMATHRIRRRR